MNKSITRRLASSAIFLAALFISRILLSAVSVTVVEKEAASALL
jgi:hypothetical protein